LELQQEMASVTNALSWLRQKIAANQELASKIVGQLSEFQRKPSTRRPQSNVATRRIKTLPAVEKRNSSNSFVLERNLLEVLLRQLDDPSLAHYPPLAMKIAARIPLKELKLTRPEDEELREKGAVRMLLRRHIRESRQSGGVGLLKVVRAWQGALMSVAVARFRLKPIPPNFDETTYLLLHPDVTERVAAGDFSTGYDHWLRFGQREGRLARFRKSNVAVRPAQTEIPGDFDEDAYLFLNPDVSWLIGKGVVRSAYEHYTAFGRKEGRAGGPLEPVPDRSSFLPLMEARADGVNIYGFLDTLSGLGSVARSCVQAIDAAGIPLNRVSIPSWAETVAERSLPRLEPYRTNLILQNPDMFALFFRTYGTELLKGCYNIGYWLWELASARSDWHHFYRYVDEIWVPSEFCRHAFECLTKLPVKRMPLVVEGLENRIKYPREYFGLPRDAFVFGYMFDVSSYFERKNPLCLIDGFKREFGNSRDVLLQLQYFNSGNDPANVRTIEEAVASASNIRAVDRKMDLSEMASLHSSIDCLVSPHRSEGFGYNMAEAMYLGKPVIATGYSSNLDFMRDDNSYLIDYDLVPIPLSYGPYLRGHVWADPSVDHLCHLMRTVFEDAAGREKKGRRAAQEIRANYSASVVGRKIANRLDEIGVRKPRLSPSIFHRHGAENPPRLFRPETPSEVTAAIRQWPSHPVISVITPVYNVAGNYLRDCVESVRAQYYPFWELCLCDDGSTSAETIEALESYRGTDSRIKIVRLERNAGIAAASNRAAEISTGEYLAMLDNDDELAPEALYEVVKAIQANPNIDLLYTDEDKISEDGVLEEHYCKPDWSPEHLMSVMYMLHLMVIRKDLFYQAGEFRPNFDGAQDYDLALRSSPRAQAIHHVSKILYHWRYVRGSASETVFAKPAALENGRRALEDYVRNNAADAWVEEGLRAGLFRVRHRIHGQPLVSLCIVVTGRTALTTNFVQSIVAKTTYPNYEIVIIGDGESADSISEALASVPHRFESFPANEPFNFSKRANFAFAHARGKHLVLLHDDMEVISPDWLEALLEFSQQDAVGAVGAKLVLADGRIQHAGMILGVNGGAAHAFYGLEGDVVAYNAYTHVIRNYSAVTAACLATRKDVIEAIGGFNEQLPGDYADVDFCLSAIQRGYRVVYTPYAELYHFENTSIQQRTKNPQEFGLFQQRWRGYIKRDPYYNSNLTRTDVDFTIDSQASGWPSKTARVIIRANKAGG
jgi:GT2 family glycosyltransferase/glycosyltransferase involved in cell wall biosynthesis